MELTQWLLLAILFVLIGIGILSFYGHSFINFALNQTKYKIRLVGHQNKQLAQAKRLTFVNQVSIDNEQLGFFESSKQRYSIPIGDIITVTIKNDYDKVFDKRFWVRLTYNLGRADIIYARVRNSEKEQLKEQEINQGPSYQIILFFFSEEDEKSFFSNINDKITDFNTKVAKEIAATEEQTTNEDILSIEPDDSQQAVQDNIVTNSALPVNLDNNSKEVSGVDEQIIKILSMDLKDKAEDFLQRFINVIDKEFFFSNLAEIKLRLNQRLKGQRTSNNDKLDLFIEIELLPFVDILKEKNLFKWSNEQDMLALLELLKNMIWERLYKEFLDKCSTALTNSSGDSVSDVILNYNLLFGDKSVDLINIEGLRRYFEERGTTYTSTELTERVMALKKEKQLDIMKRKVLSQVEEDSGRSYTIEDIDALSGEDLKDFIVKLLKNDGYKVTQVKNSNQEVELIVTKGLRKVAVLAKFNSGCIGKGSLQQALIVKNSNLCQEAIVITNSFFSNAAINLAESNKVFIWDRQNLKEKIQKR